MDIPPASTFTSPLKSGYLHKLSGRGLIYPGTWKRRYCVLDGNKLYYYEKEDSKGTERSAGVINLEYYDACLEAAPKEVRKATNVFLISTSDKSFFDSGRYYFSTETLTEMNEWVSKIRLTMERIQRSRRRGKICSSNSIMTTSASSMKSSISQDEPKNLRDDLRSTSGDSGLTTPNDCEIHDIPRASQLECMTKHRARGPRGRRLPKQRMTTMHEPGKTELERGRASSLSALEPLQHDSSFSDQIHWASRSMDLGDDDCPAQLAYRYSSSEESLDVSFNVSASLMQDLLPQRLTNQKPAHSSPFPNRQKAQLDTSGSKTISSTPTSLKRRKLRGPDGEKSVSALMADLEQQWIGANHAMRKSTSRSISDVVMETDSTADEDYVELHNGSSSYRNIHTEVARLMGVNKALHEHSLRLGQTLERVDDDVTQAHNDLGAVQENLATTRAAADATNEKVARLGCQVGHLDRQMVTMLKEVHNIHDKAQKTLDDAERARDEYLQLKQDCETLFKRLIQETLTSSKNHLDDNNKRSSVPKEMSSSYESKTLPKMKFHKENKPKSSTAASKPSVSFAPLRLSPSPTTTSEQPSRSEKLTFPALKHDNNLFSFGKMFSENNKCGSAPSLNFNFSLPKNSDSSIPKVFTPTTASNTFPTGLFAPKTPLLHFSFSANKPELALSTSPEGDCGSPDAKSDKSDASTATIIPRV